MSHFCAVVLVPNETENVQSTVDEMIAKYSEQISVDPYETECYCIGITARTDARKHAIEALGQIDENERPKYEAKEDARCHELVGGKDVWDNLVETQSDRAKICDTRDQARKELNPFWRELLSEREKMEKEYEENHPLYKKPEPTCAECKGTGVHSTTYNPLSKWDWWTIGGRWTASLKPEYNPHEDPRNKEKCFICNGTGMRNDALGLNARELDPNYTCNGCGGEGMSLKFAADWVDAGGNIEPVSSVPEDFIPYSLVTPDGEWHDKGKMGWWGISTDEKEPDEWEDFCKETFKKYADTHLAVIVDCHI